MSYDSMQPKPSWSAFGDHCHMLKLDSGSVSTSYRLLTRLFILVTYCSLIFLTSMIFSASQCPLSAKLISFCYASDALPLRLRWDCFKLIVCHSMVALCGGLIVTNWNLSGYLLTMFKRKFKPATPQSNFICSCCRSNCQCIQ